MGKVILLITLALSLVSPALARSCLETGDSTVLRFPITAQGSDGGRIWLQDIPAGSRVKLLGSYPGTEGWIEFGNHQFSLAIDDYESIQCPNE